MKRRGPRTKEYIKKLEMKLDQLATVKVSLGQVTPKASSDTLLPDLRMDLIKFYADTCLPYMNMIPKWFLLRNAPKLSLFFLNSVNLLANWRMQKYSATAITFYEQCQAMLGNYLDDQSVFTIIGLLNLAMYASCTKNGKSYQ